MSHSDTIKVGVIPHLQSVDAIRGWAIFAVIVLHVATYFPSPNILEPIAHQGVRGVQLFFIASAFTLFLSWYTRNTESHPRCSYYIRRFFRIAPLYYSAIVFWVWFRQTGFFLQSQSPSSSFEIILTIFFLNGWWPSLINAVVPGGWSVVVEMNFYLLLPFLVENIADYKSAVRFAIVISFFGILLGLFGYFFSPNFWSGEDLVNAKGFFAGFWLPISLPPFMAGMLVFFAWRENKWAHIRSIKWVIVSVVLMLLVCYLPLPLKNIIFTPLLAIFVMAVLRCKPRIIVNELSCYMGRLSYSAYFTHFLVIDLLRMALDRFSSFSGMESFLTQLLLTLFGTCILSELTFRFIENPGRRFGSAVIGRVAAR